MSAAKNKGRRNRPNFMEEEERNQMGEDQSKNEDRNKLAEKQEDVFDSHQFQPNILNSPQSRYDFDFAVLGQPQINETKEESNLPNEQDLKRYYQQLAQKSKLRNKRGRRQKKAMDSDEEGKKEKKPQILRLQQNQQQSGWFQIQSYKTLIKRDPPTKQCNQNAQQLGLKQDEISLKSMVAKKQQQNKANSNQVMMHSIMDNAGFNLQERRLAIYSPLQPNQHTIVHFKRYQVGFAQYYQVVGQDQRPILFCQNQSGSIGCNYYLSLNKQMNKNIPAYLGKLRGNAAGSTYQLYDKGKQPTNDFDRSGFRVSMAYIQYQTNILGMNGPRKLKAFLPKVKCLQDFDMYKFSGQQSLQTLPGSTVIQLRNKQAKWNEKLKSFALNFGNRVKQASLKNFILIEDQQDQSPETSNNNILVFGKTDSNTFFMEFRHPLSLFQATGIAISQFDFKLACQ